MSIARPTVPSRLRIAGMLLALVALLPQSPTRAEDPYNTYWGAIAYSQTTGKWGYSRHWLSEVNARRVAIENCKADDAKVVIMVGNYWCALALGDDVTAYGTGYSENPEQAKKFALAECQKRTKNCKIIVCFNTRDDKL